MTKLKNDRLIKALLRQDVDRTPVWMMRQAGRYLPEYRELRKEAGSFMNLCQNPELACEVTLQPLRRFPLDGAILFSDILTIPDAMGLGLHFVEGEGPQFERPIRTEQAIASLPIPDISESLSYVTDAVSLIRKTLAGDVPLIGFAGSPWTLACYMVEGRSSRDFKLVKQMLYKEPALLHQLLDKVAKTTIAYLNAQIEAGAQTVMIFDTWGGVLSTPAFEEFSLRYMQQIIDGLHLSTPEGDVPSVLFTKQGGLWLEKLAATGCSALGLDWSTDIGQARQRVGGKVALQGNMDPAVLLSNPERIKQEVDAIITRFGDGSGHVFNLGHGITPDVPVEHVEAFISAVVNH